VAYNCLSDSVLTTVSEIFAAAVAIVIGVS